MLPKRVCGSQCVRRGRLVYETRVGVGAGRAPTTRSLQAGFEVEKGCAGDLDIDSFVYYKCKCAGCQGLVKDRFRPQPRVRVLLELRCSAVQAELR
jgi:hypothetical protein